MTALEKALAVVVGEEGGYVNDPRDPGGETKFGISKRSYPNVDIRNLTLAQAQAIYERDYWSKVHGDDLPPGLALLAFDALINGGHPAQWLQAAVGVAQDGAVGPEPWRLPKLRLPSPTRARPPSPNSRRAGSPT